MATWAKVVARCKTCKAVEYRTPKGRTNDWGIDASGQCENCRAEARDNTK